jgi:hypothetical protein
MRGGSVGFIRNYILLHDEDAENRRLRAEVGPPQAGERFSQERTEHWPTAPRRWAGVSGAHPFQDAGRHRHHRHRRRLQFQGGVRGPRLGSASSAAWRW